MAGDRREAPPLDRATQDAGVVIVVPSANAARGLASQVEIGRRVT